MTTPAGWYDDGSGRQRWWDGQQWTEHFAPEAADASAVSEESAVADEQVVAQEQVASEGSSIDDTVIRPSEQTVISPESPEASSSTTPAGLTDQSAFVAPGATAATTPLGDDLGAYAAPAAPAYPAAAPAQSAGAYPGTAPAYPGSSTGYPAAAPYGQPGPEEPKKVSVLGLVGLGLAAIGTILVFIPVIGFFGFILLGAGFIVSLISLFLKGKKWPGIAGLILAVVGTVVGIVMFFVYLASFAQGVSDEIDKMPTPSPSIEASAPSETEGTTGTGRPTAEELAVGITAIIQSTGAEGYTPEHITCFADEFAASDIDDETLRIIASGDSAEFDDPDVALAFTEEFADALPVCIVP
jgi:hypothetical protein